MKTVKKNVYYCGFCNKRGEHEQRCTANPKRKCRMCGGGNVVSEIEAFKKRFILHANPVQDFFEPGDNTDSHRVEWLGEPVTIEEISKEVDGCPNCILTILRLTGMNRHYFHFEFNYKGTFAAHTPIDREERF